MADGTSRKELIAQYRERKIIGGVYVVRNTEKEKLLLARTADLQGSKNRFEFALKTGSCVDLKLQKDWESQNGEGFVFEVLEVLEKGVGQTEAEFKADIKLIEEIWREKLKDKAFY